MSAYDLYTLHNHFGTPSKLDKGDRDSICDGTLVLADKLHPAIEPLLSLKTARCLRAAMEGDTAPQLAVVQACPPSARYSFDKEVVHKDGPLVCR